MGCNLRCIHCQNWSISQWYEQGDVYSPEELASIIDAARRRGCRNQNWVGGDPIPYIPFWIKVLLYERENTPVFFNTNGYYSVEASWLLAGIVDIYKIDFKYGPGDCAQRISDAPRYWDVVTRNLLDASRRGEVLIRVLVLPNHIDCCYKPIIKWIVENLGPYTRVNIMWQYRPEYQAHKLPELRRRLTKEEMEETIKIAEEYGLKNYIT
ncbi:MAG: hypothetical protein DRJ31_04320 [Candidatus Methanomethylicota archaeon]|uniref:Radical SAM core domain-containing protein n=1 Tax=Thermoproteota archaeon TaxID=2056631 RepID=A0A497EY16_9CREN|nr:MAG: hypothetical protein DRJ31_04320 [Candidatus Verstraetearchaeota archaeon]RLE52284.1 MAG: hypothetical protein DRJ33_04165 [Candidatus Verstraetearchaeota archaeon]